jgi:hypothetical protein
MGGRQMGVKGWLPVVLWTAVSLAGCSGVPQVSPYAGEQGRAIKALSQKEVSDLLDGAGMGYAKAAELNRYPGPMHTWNWQRSSIYRSRSVQPFRKS